MLNAKFYNLIMYGADMKDCEKIANYLIDNYTVKNPFGDLARSIEKSCADLEDALNRITEAGY